MRKHGGDATCMASCATMTESKIVTYRVWQLVVGVMACGYRTVGVMAYGYRTVDTMAYGYGTASCTRMGCRTFAAMIDRVYRHSTRHTEINSTHNEIS